ncbi:MAG: glycosyltransferase family 2 protein [Candidatus Aminicenantes bacterium]|nr:glycosyltransferase family 2 protein [Candidatus Aminicenantes bacterium]
MIRLISDILDLFGNGILVYFIFLNFFYVLFIVLSVIGIIRHGALLKYITFKDMFNQPLVKPVSVIAPAFNEQNNIVENIRGLLALEYPVFEVVIVNDGSRDQTLERITQAFQLRKTKRVFRKVVVSKPIRGIYVSPIEPKLVVVDKVNGGSKADAMNAGLNVARYPLFCAIDCDSLIDRDALLKMARPFHEDPDRTVGVGGVVRIINDCVTKNGQVEKVRMPRNWLARFQIIEYMRSFLGSRLGLSKMNSLLIISGAFGMFRKDVAMECGGYDPTAIGEDMELVCRITRILHERKAKFRIQFVPDVVCWTEGPEQWKWLINQRNRWQRGLIQVIQFNSKVLFNHKYGATGMFALPFYLIFEMLSPLIELLGYLTLAFFIATKGLNTPFAIKFLLLAVVMGTLLSLSSIILEEYAEKRFPRLVDVVILFICGIVENLGYRQVIAFTRAKGFWDYYHGKNEWKSIPRVGFSKEQEKK